MKHERIGDDVRRELGQLGPGGAIADVVAAWPEAVGDSIARNAWPARIARDGTLHVATSSSAWAFELGCSGGWGRRRRRVSDSLPGGCRRVPLRTGRRAENRPRR